MRAVSDWSPESADAVRRFCDARGFVEVPVRIDKHAQRWTTRRGGYLVPLARVAHLVCELADEGMISVLLEPVSPSKSALMKETA
jgi:hypothetical protein